MIAQCKHFRVAFVKMLFVLITVEVSKEKQRPNTGNQISHKRESQKRSLGWGAGEIPQRIVRDDRLKNIKLHSALSSNYST